jgi:hypothetical protein
MMRLVLGMIPWLCRGIFFVRFVPLLPPRDDECRRPEFLDAIAVAKFAKCLVGSSSVTRNPPPVRWLSGKNSRPGSGVSKNSGSGNWFDLWDDSSNFYAPV